MKSAPKQTAKLTLKDGNVFEGIVFGSSRSVSGEVVFNTGMVGYPETLTDPSYRGQILVMTYPLIGNYGVPPTSFGDKLLVSKKSSVHKTGTEINERHDNTLPNYFESDRIQIQGLIVSEASESFSHWNSIESLDFWLKRFAIPGISGIDTRRLTKVLREHGTMLGKIEIGKDVVQYYNPDIEDLISKVTIPNVQRYGTGKKRILLIDCGCKKSILQNLIDRKVSVLRVPYDYDVEKENYDGVLISNGPGNPVIYKQLVASAKKLIQKQVPTLGICMGHQILSLAAGAKTYKLKYGHRSQNQPVKQVDSNKCYVTSQNHSFAVDTKSLPRGWEPWFENLNDYSNEGVRHEKLPFRSVQFHPEAMPGPVDSGFIFDEFLRDLK
ncbi:MAG: carbamoyl-phosphate synthase (glutamine-hydrolyzing) small subunit [Ignavibacteriae bacterium HGW-Ignavibacteriae-3]|nr:MAG: carbamoyl-phosphate synthase (glutamine-hydrolyzing) small subunit [Ignavibacteriae bacterium HGW-Ignavibacteriae-3]